MNVSCSVNLAAVVNWRSVVGLSVSDFVYALISTGSGVQDLSVKFELIKQQYPNNPIENDSRLLQVALSGVRLEGLDHGCGVGVDFCSRLAAC